MSGKKEKFIKFTFIFSLCTLALCLVFDISYWFTIFIPNDTVLLITEHFMFFLHFAVLPAACIFSIVSVFMPTKSRKAIGQKVLSVIFSAGCIPLLFRFFENVV